MEKLTDNEIIKALEYCCGSIQNDCRDCPFGERCENDESLLKYSLDLINRQKEEKEHLEYVLMAVMHSVDKWLEGDELKQDEANRACTMREKTLKITEKLHKKIDGLQRANQESFVAIEKRKAEIERLNNELISADEVIGFREAEIESLKADKIIAERHEKDARELYKDVVIQLKTAKSEAYKEFAERLKEKRDGGTYPYVLVNVIDNLLKELTCNLHETCTEGGNEDGMD